MVLQLFRVEEAVPLSLGRMMSQTDVTLGNIEPAANNLRYRRQYGSHEPSTLVPCTYKLEQPNEGP